MSASDTAQNSSENTLAQGAFIHMHYPVGSRIHVFESAGQIGAMSKSIPLFRTTNWFSYSQALKRRGALMVWFDPEM